MRATFPLLAVLAMSTGAGYALAEECIHWSSDAAPENPNELYMPTPDPDPFYAQPDPMPCVPPGTLLDSREILFTPTRGATMPQHAAWRLKFLSTNTFGNPIAAVATVVKPMKANAAVPPRLLSYQFFENSLGMVCAPSHVLAGGSDNPPSEFGSVLYLSALIEKGWTLVVPDHEGPLSAYGVPVGGAHITLDAIRAALGFAPLGLDGIRTPVALWGFSGGSIPSAWAASLQHTYAPELNVVGMASGGTIVDPDSFVRLSEGNLFFFKYAFIGAIGITRVFPDFFPVDLLNANGMATARAVRDGCDGARTDGQPPPSGHFSDYTVTDPFATPEWAAVAAQIRLPQPGLTPRTSSYVYHSTGDEVVPIELVDSLVQAWCDDGAQVVYDRIPSNLPGPAANHVSSAFTGWAGAMRFLESRLEDAEYRPPPTARTCN